MTDARPKHNRNWIWFFTGLVLLTVLSVAIQIWHNAGQQLTAEKLHAAMRLWKEQGPRDYDLEYSIRRENEPDMYRAQIRKGQVAAATRNGTDVEPRLLHYSDMNALFGFIEEFLIKDTEETRRRVFAVATFDAADGHLLHYVRSVSGERQRVEITVTELKPLGKQ